jgi:hypothetical protein
LGKPGVDQRQGPPDDPEQVRLIHRVSEYRPDLRSGEGPRRIGDRTRESWTPLG